MGAVWDLTYDNVTEGDNTHVLVARRGLASVTGERARVNTLIGIPPDAIFKCKVVGWRQLPS